MDIDAGDKCVLIYSLSKLNAERSNRGQKALSCDLKENNELRLATFPVSNPKVRELRHVSPYGFVSLKAKEKKSLLGKGYCSDVYLVKEKGKSNVKVLKYNRGGCGSFHEDADFFKIMCAVTKNPVSAQVLSKNILVTNFVQGETLHKHLLDGDFFANKDGMMEKMIALFREMLSASLLYRDIHTFNFIFDKYKKNWVIVDSHYPVLFDSPSVALKYLKQTPWDHEDFPPELKRQLLEFYGSLTL